MSKTRFGWSSGLGNDGSTRPVLTAVSRKTLSPQTMGVLLPTPGSLTFHRTFSVAENLVG